MFLKFRLLAMFCICLPMSQAEVFILHSGEVIKGIVTTETDTHITISSAILGDLRIEKDQVQRRTPKADNAQLQPLTADLSAATTKPSPKQSDPPEKNAEAAQTPAVPKAKDNAAAKAQPKDATDKQEKKAGKLTGEVAFSMRHRDSDTTAIDTAGKVQKRRNDEVHTNFSGKVNFQLPKSEFSWNALYRYKTNDRGNNQGRFTDNDRYTLSQSYKRDVSKELFMESFSYFERNIDLFQLYEYRQSFGLGWDFLEKPTLRARVSGFGGYQWLEDQFGFKDGRFVPTLTQSVQWKPNKTFTASQSLEYVGYGQQYSANLSFSAEQKFIANIFLRLRYEYFYDNYFDSLDPSTIEQTVTELVYKFKF